MKRYKVLWLDDECKTLEEIDEAATIADIDLVGFTNAKEGIVELKNNLLNFDAVLLDGIFYENPDDVGDVTTGDRGLVDVLYTLRELENEKKIPWFILSGMRTFNKGENPYIKKFDVVKVYDKNKPEDLEELWSAIRGDADKQEDTQIRHAHNGVFAMFENGQLNRRSQDTLHSLLLQCSEQSFSEKPFNMIRDVLEDVLLSYTDNKILPSDFIDKDGKVSPTLAIRYFRGQVTDIKRGNKLIVSFESTKARFPEHISQLMDSVSKISAKFSHVNSKEYSAYTIVSTVYALCDVIVWYKGYLKENDYI